MTWRAYRRCRVPTWKQMQSIQWRYRQMVSLTVLRFKFSPLSATQDLTLANQKLRAARDLLLPRLLSGAIAI